MLKWTVAGQRGGGTAWRQTTVVDESPQCFSEKPRRRRPSRMSGKHDKENAECLVSYNLSQKKFTFYSLSSNVQWTLYIKK